MISEDEFELVVGCSTLDYSGDVITYGIGNTTEHTDGYGASWWLRSPHAGDSSSLELGDPAGAVFVDYLGGMLFLSVDLENNGIRAAFQITIG